MGKRIYRVLFLSIFVLILAFQFKLSYDLETQPPSKEWSKELLISHGNVRAYPKIIRINNNSLIAHDDGDKVKVMLIDEMGNKLKEASLNADDAMVRDLNLLYDGKNIYADWIITKDGNKILNTVVLDSNLNEIKREQKAGVDQAVQIEDNVLLTLSGNKIQFLDITKDKSLTIDGTSVSGYLSGTKTKDGYLVVFMDKEQTFKFFTVKDGRASDIKQAGIMHKNNFDTFDKTALAADGSKGYILVEVKNKGEFGAVKCLAFNLDGNSYEIKDLKVGSIRYLYNPITVSSKDEARFTACSERKFGKKNEQYDVVDFSIKDGKVVRSSFVSRTRATTLFPAASIGNAVFCDYMGENSFNIYMSSQNKQFMDKINGVKKFEIKNVVGQTINGLINSILYVFIIGSRWVLIGGVLIAVFTFMSYSLSPKKKKIYFLIVYGLTEAIKLYIMSDLFYKQYAGILTGVLSSVLIGLAIMLILGVITMFYGYNEYKDNIDAMPVISYTKALAVDTVLTLMIFVPFLV